jgi:hypothetical protein
VRQTTIIKTLRNSNDAYAENNRLLTEQLAKDRLEFRTELASLRGKITTLEKIKTPPLEPLIALVTKNHTEVMQALERIK